MSSTGLGSDDEAMGSGIPLNAGPRGLKLIDVVWIGTLAFALSFAFGLLYSLYLRTQGYDTQSVVAYFDLPEGRSVAGVLGLAAMVVGPLGFIGFFARLRHLHLKDFGFRKTDGRYFLYAIIGLSVVLGLGVMLEALLDAADVDRLNSANADLLVPDGPLFFVSLLLVVLLVPFAEELFFRAALHGALVRHMPPFVAGLLGAGIFSLVHTQYLTLGGWAAIAGLFQIFLLGLILVWLYVRSGSIWPSVLLHVVNNAIAFVAVLYLV